MENKIEAYQALKAVQKQGLILSQKMTLSLHIMQLSSLDLREEILKELEKNVALELVKDPSEKRNNIKLSKKDNEYLNNIEFIENIEKKDSSIQSVLLSELSLIKAKKCVIALSKLIIQNLDEHGINFTPINELIICQKQNKKFNKDDVIKAIKIVRNLEPIGCGFDSLALALRYKLYLSYKKKYPNLKRVEKALYSVASILLANYFPHLKDDNLNKLIIQLKKDKRYFKNLTIKKALDLIKMLPPYPTYHTNIYSNNNNQYIIPDVYVNINENDVLVTTNKSMLPKLKISEQIIDFSKEKGEVGKFARTKIKEAKDFLSSIDERNETLLKVAKELTIFQKDFFYYGISYLSPLRQKDLAEELKLSTSTISRIANNKYLSCQWGTFPISYFFTQKAISNKEKSVLPIGASYVNSGYSKQACMEMIKTISVSHPEASDRMIAQMLEKKGIKISRRTIAKYREELGIKNSRKREDK